MNDDIAPESSDELMRFCEKLGKPSQPEPKPNLKFFRNNLRSAMSLYDADVHKVPELDRFNIVPECKEQEVCLFEGGETKALQLFKKRILYEKECFKHGEVHPNIKKGILFSEEISFSPYLRFGCLSVRKFYWDIKKAYNRVIDCFIQVSNCI
jgi:cryptochrome